MSKNSIYERVVEEYILKQKFDINDIFENTNDKCILITGQVQSGKTKWIIDIIKTAIKEYKFNSIILLGGYTKKLLNQTQQRLEKELSINGKEWKINNNISEDETEFIYYRIYNILKNTKQLDSLYNKMKYATNLKETNEYKILFIDDECDFFSIKNNNVDNENQKIYNKLKEIYSLIKNIDNSIYINVTATPYANILNNSIDFELDALYILPTNEKYTGWEFFSQKENVYLSNAKYFTKNEKQNYINLLSLWITQSFLYNFLENKKNSELVIFTDEKKKNHQQTGELIKQIINENENELLLAFKELKKENEENEYFYYIKEEDFLNSVKNLQKEADNSIIVLNSDTKDNKENNTKWKIYIGNKLLSRGLTFENLTVEYIAKFTESTPSDTLLQRCRWFGYRKKMSDYMKIVAPKQFVSLLSDCKNIIKIFHDSKTINGAKLDISKTYSKLTKIKNNIQITSNNKKGY